MFVVFRNIIFLLFVTWQLLNTIRRFELFPSAGTMVVFRFVLLDSGIPKEFGGLRYVRVRKWNTFSQIPRHRGKKLNPRANTPTAVKMSEINPKYENTRKIQQLLTNQNPGFFFFLTSISQILFSKYLVTFLLQSPSSSEVSLWNSVLNIQGNTQYYNYI